jgi:hypothetical protein
MIEYVHVHHARVAGKRVLVFGLMIGAALSDVHSLHATLRQATAW